MKKQIDCLLIGHNDMNFGEYEESIRKMGIHSGAYRDLNLHFLQFKNKPYHLSGIFNLFYSHDEASLSSVKPVSMFDSFSATIAYLASYLNRYGLIFDYVSSFQDEKEVLAEKLKQHNIRTIAITTTYYVSAIPILEIIDFIRKYNSTAKIIIGGPFIATKIRSLEDPMLIEYLFKNTLGADFFVNSSQGESALVKIIQALNNDLSLDQINNIYYKSGDTYIRTPTVRENNILTENMVNWDLFLHDIDEYVNIRTSISCPFSCAFCGFPEHAGKFQTAGAQDLEKELNQLARIESLKGIKFIDDTFNVPVKRYKEILRMMIKNKYKFKWNSNFRCQFVDREMVELMKESGCEMVFLGLESGNNQILKNMNKSALVEDYLEGIRLLKEYGIITFASFIIGFPGETEQTVKETIRFIKESGIDFFRAAVWFCEHITPIWRERERYKLSGESFEWRHATMDSKQASGFVDEIFLSIDDPLWIPLYNFDIDTLWHLIHRGVPLDKVRKLIGNFNRGIREKLIDPSRREVSISVLQQLKMCCKTSNQRSGALVEEGNKTDRFNADFDLD
jgi:radical SAM PhpK family P-methyltransferase